MESSGGLTAEHIAGMFRHFEEHGDATIGGVALTLSDLGKYHEPSLDPLDIDTGMWVARQGSRKWETHRMEIGAGAWRLAFISSVNPIQMQMGKSYWDGKSYRRVEHVEVYGDLERFKHDATLILLFASEWMPDPDPHPWDLSSFKGGIGFSSGRSLGKSSITKSTMMSLQQIGRSQRAVQAATGVPAIFVDTEASYDRKMFLTVIKNR
jgi:hypothetical protein